MLTTVLLLPLPSSLSQAALKSLETIDPTALMNELAALAKTMEAIDLSRRRGIPCDPCTWPSELIRNEALMSMPGAWAEEESGWGQSTGGEADSHDGSGEYQQAPRAAHMFSLEAALEASATKQAQRSQNKRKKKKRGKK